MSLSLPTFNELRANYPLTSHESMMAAIGGGVSAKYILNGCVIRMSKAFNYLGNNGLEWKLSPAPNWKDKPGSQFDFSKDKSAIGERAKIHAIPSSYKYISHFTTTYGLDKKRYCFRVDEFFNYMNHKYKKFDLKIEKEPRQQMIPYHTLADFKKLIQGKSGIICFKTKFGEDAPGTAASGHFTLWDGNACLYGEYFNDPRTTGIYLWKC